MGKVVIARQDGDDYQAKFFWLKASTLNFSDTHTSTVTWESDSTFGFDDVTVEYDPPILESGSEVTNEYYQVKFHVDHSNGLTCNALIDPEFIGAKNESLLQRLLKIYKSNPENFAKSRYYMINTWGLDRTDEAIGSLLSNIGAIRLDKLFKGGEASLFGKVRKAWKEHLNIDDEDLKKLLAPLRIKHSYDDEQRLKENLNLHLRLAGLMPIPLDERATKYVDLIQKLHKEGKNTLTKDNLLEICEREGLLSKHPVERADDILVLGVRSFQKGAESLEIEVNRLWCLLHLFSGRFILEEHSWDKAVIPVLEEMAECAIAAQKPTRIHLDTHLSIALYLGYCLNVKYGGLDISIVQKSPAGKIIWKPSPEKVNEYTNQQWQYEESHLGQGTDIALAVGVTHDIRSNVEDFLKTSVPSVGNCIHASILPRPGYASIRDASQIVAAVQDLVSFIRKKRKIGQPPGTVHLFITAPNAFAFFLGQYLKPLGCVLLYEFDFENSRGGSYHPAIKISNI